MPLALTNALLAKPVSNTILMNENREESSTQHNLSLAIFRILRSVAKIGLRYGMSTGAMAELLRRASIEAAQDLLREEQSKVTTASVCAMTGLYRKEIRRIEQLPSLADSSSDDKYNRSVRVITGWRRDPEFHTRAGKPAALTLDGDNGFDALVRKYSGDMTPVAMKHELERLGLISVTSNNLVKLESRAYLSSRESDIFQILGTDTTDLINTITHNVSSDKSNKLFQRKVSYESIPEQYVDEFLGYAANESQSVLEKLDKWLDERDKKPASTNSNEVRIGVGIYHFRQDARPTMQNSPADPDQEQ